MATGNFWAVAGWFGPVFAVLSEPMLPVVPPSLLMRYRKNIDAAGINTVDDVERELPQRFLAGSAEQNRAGLWEGLDVLDSLRGPLEELTA